MSKIKVSKILLVIPIVLIALLLLAGLFNNIFKRRIAYNISEVFLVEILGTEGYGYANVSVNPDFVEKAGISLSDISYTINKTSNLSNDDYVEISLDKPKEIIFDKYVYSYKVTGLCKGTDLDVFKDLAIKYDAQTKEITLDNLGCSEFIKENVIFAVKRQGKEYEPGDIIEIIAYVDMNAASDNRYNILSTIYEYEVQ